MVEPILYASFGALLATLIGLLFLPAFWGRAVRLTTKRLIGRLPVSAAEIVASQDRLRAEQAMAMRAIERRAEQAVAQAAGDRLEAARARSAELGQLADMADLRAKVAELEAEHAKARSDLDRTGAEASAATLALKTAYADGETARRALEAARKDAGAARLATDQSRIEAAAREVEMAALRAEIAEGKIQIEKAKDALVAKERHEAELARLLKAEAARAADADAARAGAERRLAEAGVAASGADPAAAQKTDGDAEMKALRARLDEVADQIVRASAERGEEPAPMVSAPASQAEPDPEDRLRRLPPIPQSAGAH